VFILWASEREPQVLAWVMRQEARIKRWRAMR
jgi:hypothetical protein